MAQAGRLDTRVTFRRRAYITARERGDFEDILTVSAQYIRSGGREAMEAGRPVNLEEGMIRIRDSSEARDITSADRVSIRGRDHRLTTVSLPDRRTGLISMAVTTDLGET